MVGMWRWVSGGKAKIYELLSFTAGAEGVSYRLRHFDHEMAGWEKERDGPLTLNLVRSREGEAVFEGPEAGGTTVRLTYRRRGADVLVVLLEKETKEGPKKEEFRMKREPL